MRTLTATIRLLTIALPLAGLAACSSLQARTPVPDPALLTPVPPPRVIVPATITIPEPDPPAQAAPPVRPNPPPSRPPDRPATSATPPPVPAETAATATPPPVLQTKPDVGDLEVRTRATLAKANGDLAKINPRTLGPDARAQYDTAKGFIRQADEALRAKNLNYAKELAEKAAALAGLLVK